jgi:hypothetical protein
MLRARASQSYSRAPRPHDTQFNHSPEWPRSVLYIEQQLFPSDMFKAGNLHLQSTLLPILDINWSDFLGSSN